MLPPLFIKWQNKNNTGIQLIDEQHRGIVSIVNSFYYLAEKGMCNDALFLSITKTLKSYSLIHFIVEERILKATEYPDLAKHIETHRKLSLETKRIEYEAIRDNDPMLLLKFLKKWWIEHINGEDMDYVPHLRMYEENRQI
ncbi:MAG: bacteriohemerythrin [Azoarcus sp.]|jgi:hemerythrin-like metal-binding protein|nr:bacteriohemerythrin [Azoarcus sp.]